MKRILAFILVLCLMLTPFALISCDDSDDTTTEKKDPLVKFYEKMNEKQNFTMKLSMSLMGTAVEQIFEYSGDMVHTLESILSKESYTIEKDSGVEEYAKTVFGKWIKNSLPVEAEDDANDIFAEEMDALFNPDSYTIKGKVYTQKEGVTFESFKDVVVTVEDGKCVIEMTMTMEGIGFEVTLELYKVGESSFTIPTDYVTVDIVDNAKTAKEALQGNGYAVERYTTGSYIDAILEGWGAYGADAHSIILGEKGDENVILVYCSDDASAEIMYEAFIDMLDGTYNEIITEYGINSTQYTEFYQNNKDTVIGRDGTIVCLTSSPNALNAAK